MWGRPLIQPSALIGKTQYASGPIQQADAQAPDGFNESGIEFEDGEAGSRKGTIPLEAALKSLIDTA